MCGIFGVVNGRPITHAELIAFLINGLKRLEYRGYDSAGISVDTQIDSASSGEYFPTACRVIKNSGNVQALADLIATDDELSSTPSIAFTGMCGIAHTRWATHGLPCYANSHPHSSDMSNRFVVVHNGIVTNYASLKTLLESKGFQFDSMTDTEVIAKLALWIWLTQGGASGSVAELLPRCARPGTAGAMTFVELVMAVMERIEGAYALLFKSSLFPGECVGCKVGSPLLLGVQYPVDNNGSACASIGPTDPKYDHPTSPTSLQIVPIRSGAQPLSISEQWRSVNFFFASDSAALVEHTRNAIVLDDGDVVHVQVAPGTSDEIGPAPKLTRLNVKRGGRSYDQAKLSFSLLDGELHSIMKGVYSSFMLKEIYEQHMSLATTMAGRLCSFGPGMKDIRALPTRVPGVAAVLEDNREHTRVPGVAAVLEDNRELTVTLGGLRDHLHSLRTARRFVYIASGTSYYSCVAMRGIMEHFSGLPVVVEVSSDFLDRTPPVFRDDVCVFVSQSGETADILAALEYCRRAGALLLGITNVVGSSVSRATHCGVHLNAGAEIGVASTKAYTSQLVVHLMIASVIGGDSLRLRPECNALVRALYDLPDSIQAMMAGVDARVKAIAEHLHSTNAKGLLILGRGAQYATALEGALKVKEIAYLMTEGIQAGELKHGPLALIDEKMPIIFIATRDAVFKKTLTILEQITARSGLPWVLCHEDETDIDSKYETILVPRVHESLQGIVNIIPFQLLAYHLAVLRGYNVDCPRNLAKSVTVTETR